MNKDFNDFIPEFISNITYKIFYYTKSSTTSFIHMYNVYKTV